MKKAKGLSAFVAIVLLCLLALTACGETAGKSAYELAVENGFEGTQDEWLDSLQGRDGKDGTNGVDGKDGVNGIDGIDGKDCDYTLKDYYDAAVEAGFNGSYLDFITQKCSALKQAYDDVTTISGNLLSSVSIVSGFDIVYQDYDFFLRPMIVESKTTTYGSGFLYKVDLTKGDAYVVTNFHVVYHMYATTENKISDNINVILYGYSSDDAIKATFVAGSMQYDIALLRIEQSSVLRDSEAQSVEFADSNVVTAGQTAIAVGNGGGNGIAVTKGVVSVDSESVLLARADGTGTRSARVLRVDCAINEGNSGGGLFDSAGKLIGVVNAKQESSSVDNVAYAIPSNVARYLVENILYYAATEGTPQLKKCVLGITLSDVSSYAHYDDASGKTFVKADVTVDEEGGVDENAPASGILQNGDVIKELRIDRAGGEEAYDEAYVIDRSFVVVDLMLTMRVGDKVRFSLERNGAPLDAVMEMTESCIEVCE